MMRWLNLRTLALLSFLLLGACDLEENRSCPNEWKLYQKDPYDFSFCYPADSYLREKIDRNFQDVRIQNYDSEQKRGDLFKSEYYLELFLYDHKKGHRYSRMENSAIYRSCADKLMNRTAVPFSNTIGYRGTTEGFEAGGKPFALCVQQPDLDIYLRVTEGNSEGIIANKILDSFSLK
jgi:hypothetical protein